MMLVMYNTVGNMLATEIKSSVAETKKQIVFSYYYKSKVVHLDGREFRFYTSTLFDLRQ